MAGGGPRPRSALGSAPVSGPAALLRRHIHARLPTAALGGKEDASCSLGGAGRIFVSSGRDVVVSRSACVRLGVPSSCCCCRAPSDPRPSWRRLRARLVPSADGQMRSAGPAGRVREDPAYQHADHTLHSPGRYSIFTSTSSPCACSVWRCDGGRLNTPLISPTPPLQACEVAEDVVAVLDELGVDKVVVVAHSYGTFVSSILAQVRLWGEGVCVSGNDAQCTDKGWTG